MPVVISYDVELHYSISPSLPCFSFIGIYTPDTVRKNQLAYYVEFKGETLNNDYPLVKTIYPPLYCTIKLRDLTANTHEAWLNR